MKTILFTLAFLFVGFAQAGTPIETIVPIDEVYSPAGFDSNDSSEVVVSGWLPNLCHKSPKTSFTIKNNKIDIKVTALKYNATNPFCPELIVPFVKSINVGILDKGRYQISVNGSTIYAKNSEIQINESSSSAVDDFIYANVHYVQQKSGTNMVNLNGYNPSDCLVLDKVKFIDNGVNAFSVLPIMKKVSDFCPMKLVPFSHSVEVPDTLKHKKILLHVRSMDGNSVNSLLMKI